VTERQQKLLDYLQAIRPELEGARDYRDLADRVARCVAADAGFVAQGLAVALRGAVMKYAELRADTALGSFSRFVQDLVEGKRR
jgi:hypothetical protein